MITSRIFAVLGWMILGAMLALAGPAAAGSRNSVPLRAMTYNIRLDLASDGENAWPMRREIVAALIRHEAPDILGMQEVLLGQKSDLEQALPELAMVGGGRDDGKNRGEFSPIAYRRERFVLLDSGTFWLSRTPETPSKDWDAAYPRIATWAVLRDRKSGWTLRVLNTHFDHLGIVARRESAALLSNWLMRGAQARLPTILMGDLNATPDDMGYRLLAETSALGLRDARANSETPVYGPPGTFNGFKIDARAPAPIDHIFVSGRFHVQRYSVVTQHWGGRLPSDHYPVVADLRFVGR
jgi:endonuclease/exonuclease/phosphatase family metal-dependent hydrolase